MKKTILVTGGAGYIGSHIAYLLAAHQYSVVILDSFLYGQTFDPSWATVIKGDIGDVELIKTIVRSHKIHAIIHCAARIEVGLSVTDPAVFYETNLINAARFLEVVRQEGVRKIIFSSTCAIYGDPVTLPLHENHSKNPLNPYGRTKYAFEGMLQDYEKAYGFSYISLRYFNASGALPEVGIGEMHDPETHLIPLVIHSLYTGQPVKIFGIDYATPDGTAIRDYVHVMDIARAHLKALEHLEKTGVSAAFNLGTGSGHSVKKIIKTVETLTGKKVPAIEMPRRVGDAEVLVADPTHARNILGWEPEQSSLEFIIQSALKWEEMRMQIKKKKMVIQVA